MFISLFMVPNAHHLTLRDESIPTTSPNLLNVMSVLIILLERGRGTNDEKIPMEVINEQTPPSANDTTVLPVLVYLRACMRTQHTHSCVSGDMSSRLLPFLLPP